MLGRNLPTATVAKQREKQARTIRANLFVGQHAFHANRTIHARHQAHRASAKRASSGLGQRIIIQLDNQLSRPFNDSLIRFSSSSAAFSLNCRTDGGRLSRIESGE